MKSVTTARGKAINMQALAAQNETARAVGNKSVNARGDIIDSRGNVKVTAEKKAKALYAAPVVEQEQVSFSNPEPVAETPEATEDETGTVEISRELRTRKDGTEYYEVEYSDGSMEEIEND
ncbi:hypothetical protein N9578_00855 [bacterium]|nr:hypothetical protein [bacterium]MDB4128579.1 hypothetical protein [bacterium]